MGQAYRKCCCLNGPENEHIQLMPKPKYEASSHEQVSSSSVEQFPRVASSSHEQGNAAAGIAVDEVQSEEPVQSSQVQREEEASGDRTPLRPGFAASSHEQVSSSSVEQFPKVASSSHEQSNAAAGIAVEEVKSEEPAHSSQEQGTSAPSETALGAAATEEVQREEEDASGDRNQTKRSGSARWSSTWSISEEQPPDEAFILFDICKVYTGARETTGDKQLIKYVDFEAMLENIQKYDYFKEFLGLADKCIEDIEQHLLKVFADLGHSRVSKLEKQNFVTVVNSCREHVNNNDMPEPKKDVVARTLMIFHAMDEDSSGKVTENEFGFFLNKKKCVSRALGFSSVSTTQRAQFHALCGDDNVCEESEFYDFVANHGQGLTDADREALQALQTKTKEAEDAKRLTPLSPKRKSSLQGGILAANS